MVSPRRILSVVIATVVLAALPASSLAQDEPASPEGIDWYLTSYLGDAGVTQVPITVDASLRLEDGRASGVGGCSPFEGPYELDASSFVVGDELSRSPGACSTEAHAIERAYLGALALVEGWAIADGVLELLDADDRAILTFEPPAGTWTASELERLLARLAEVEAAIATREVRVDDIAVADLRDRIGTLEADIAALEQQVAALQASGGTAAGSGTSGGSGAAGSGTTGGSGTGSGVNASVKFNAAEKVLLEGVPTRIAGTCRPLRQRLPAGTAAAVECSPNTSRVTEMAYYLLEGPRAVELFQDRMQAGGAQAFEMLGPPGQPTCEDGDPAYIYADGGGIAAIGCFIDGGRANVRIIEDATACKQLRVGKRQLKRPVMYVAMTGASGDIRPLYRWAQGGPGLISRIDRPNARKATGVGCP